jgi:glycerophosphoryl diester phosphodiesterase
MPARLVVIAHRGASGYRPEHTLASYELAIRMGADFIEPDLCITRDGVLIARHENELSRATDVAGRPDFQDRRTRKAVDGVELEGWFAEDFTLAEIKTLRARQRFPFRDAAFDGQFEIATFEEALGLARRHGVGVYPETKHPTYFRQLGLPLEESMVEALHAAGFQGRDAPVFLQSFETGNLRHLRTLTDLPLVQLLDVDGRPWDDARSYDDLATPAGLAEVSSYADGIGPNKRMIVPAGPDLRLLSPTTLVENAHRAGLLVHPWTLRSDGPFLAPDYQGDPEREYEQLLGLGVDGLFSDFPDLARRMVDGLEPTSEQAALPQDPYR